MGIRSLSGVLCLLAGLAGCQTGGNTELMERELRLQEDRIYELEDELQRHCKLLEACRRENEALKGARAARDTQSTSTGPAASDRDQQRPAAVPPPVSDDELTPPKVEIDLPPVPPSNSSGDSVPSLQTPQLNAPGSQGGDFPASSVEPDPGSAARQPPLRIRINAGGETTAPETKDRRVASQPEPLGRENASRSRPIPQPSANPRTATAAPPTQRPQWSPYR